MGHLSCAYLVPPRDPAAASEAMIRLMNDHDLRQKLAEAGPGCIDRLGFTRDRIINQTRAAYREAAAEAALSRLPRRPA